MFYPEEFKERAKHLYPLWLELHEKLDNNDESATQDLANQSNDSLPLDQILTASSLIELQNIARDAQEKLDLSEEAWRLYYSQKSSHDSD